MDTGREKCIDFMIQMWDSKTDKIRLEILKARNGSQARLYEVRVYYEH